MAFEGLTTKISSAFKGLRSKGRLTEGDIKDAMREIRMALLEADVNFKVTKDFIKAVTEKATDTEILESLSPAQQVIKIVNEELTALLGGQTTRLTIAPNPPTIVMMVGLQGAGKTTNCAKLASLLRRQQQRRPLLVACDVYRPAAIEQLGVVGRQLDIKVYDEGQGDPVEIAQHGVDFARRNGFDLVFLDTAGRLHIDEKLMDELKRIKSVVHPNEILLVVDAMTGQDAVNVASSFDERIGIDGVILTKLDGDARGGAALSVRFVTGKPIFYAGMGEKLEDLEVFNPARMANRILGMGDVLSLIEKAQNADFDEEASKEAYRKLRKNEFDLEDFLEQLRQMNKMGGLGELMKMLPGVGSKLKGAELPDDRSLKHVEAIILSMTKEERRRPDKISPPRKRRIANGSGTTIQDVNRLLKQFEQSRQMMKQMNGRMGKKGRMPFRLPF